MRTRELSWLVFLTGLGAGCGTPSTLVPGGSAAVDDASQHQVKPATPTMDYVGSHVCAECHRKIADQYATHPMGQSSGPLAAVSPIEDYDDSTAFVSKDGKRYAVERGDTGFVHHEQLTQDESAPLYDQRVAMELSIGSGRRGRSYAYRRGDRLFMSPIGWYTTKGCWDLSPGYLPGKHQRFDRVLTERCLGCHIGRMNSGPVPDSWNREQPIVEHAISCERCHGPGATHVDHHRHPESFAGVDRIVNPVALDPIRRDAVCHQCHFKASKTIPRYGRRASDFRPGDRMSDIWVVLPDQVSERQAVTQSEQMLSSMCYRGSSGRMGCVSCHNPHALPTGDPAVAFDRKCAACHSDVQSPCAAPIAERSGQTCIGCHMPRFEIQNIPHTALTDHRILKHPENHSGANSLVPLEQVFDEGEPALPEWEIRRAQALILRTDRRLVRSPLDLDRAAMTLRGLKDRIADDPELWETLAWIASRQGKWTDVEVFAQKALELSPERIDSRELLVGALSDRAAWTDVTRECKNLIQRDSGKALYHKMLAEAAWHQGDLEGGLASAEQSLQCDPTQRDLLSRLSVAYGQLGNSERSLFHRKVLESLPQAGP